MNKDYMSNLYGHSNKNIATRSNKEISKMIKFRRRKLRFQKKLFSQERRMRKLHQLSKIKNMTITCPELNNVTFTNAPPFDILGIPECVERIQPKMR